MVGRGIKKALNNNINGSIKRDVREQRRNIETGHIDIISVEFKIAY